MPSYILVSLTGIIVFIIAIKAGLDRRNENWLVNIVIGILVLICSLINLSDFLGYYMGNYKVDKVQIQEIITQDNFRFPLIKTSNGRMAVAFDLKDKIIPGKEYIIYKTPVFGRILNLKRIK